MTDRAIVQGALMALTLQNRTDRAAPASTALMTGTVIRANVRVGDTVCCYLSGSGSLTRMGVTPTSSGGFFVDADNRLYDVSGQKLRVRDGLSGEILEHSEAAYGFLLGNANQCCAYRTSSSENSWVVIYPDGARSAEITLSFAPSLIACRNGVLSVVFQKGSGGYGGAEVYNYDRDGTLMARLHDVSGSTTVVAVIPINRSSAAVECWLASVNVYETYRILTTADEISTKPWEDYYTGDNIWKFIGFDQAYAYGEYRSSAGPPELFGVVKWEIDTGLGAQLVASYEGRRTYGPPNTFGHLIRQRQETGARDFFGISDWSPLYTDELTTAALPGTSAVQENADCIWIGGASSWAKTASGLLMYPTGVYPRSAPYGRLGYAVSDANVGTTGTAVVLFE